MSMDYIRKHYGVPAKRGARVRYTYDVKLLADEPREGVIVGSRGAGLRVRMDGDKRVGMYHPTWNVEYLD